MSDWTPVSELVRRLNQHPVPDSSELRDRAGGLVVSAFGPLSGVQVPELVNIAMLSILMTPKLTVLEPTLGVIGLVASTDLHVYPSEAPTLLRQPFLIESKRPDLPLFGWTASLGGYTLDGILYLVGAEYPDGTFVAPMKPKWTGEEILGIEFDDPVLGDATALGDWSVQAMRFAVVLGAILDAEHTPIAQKTHTETTKKRNADRTRDRSEWIMQRLYVDRIYQTAFNEKPSSDGTVGKTLMNVPVRAHLRHQPYGPGLKKRKWVWIQGYEARRWVSPSSTRIIVGRQKN
ncbi:hypothetical protein [Alkalispirochaeta alkalica]|uniref:hypothetical protein n=1 Tax=Alkalispirochaeta alkalica TaxID=46356 RepID=UPI00037B8B60|nr:hypothetical protein [Alkalispirochaeta alkalica]